MDTKSRFAARFRKGKEQTAAPRAEAEEKSTPPAASRPWLPRWGLAVLCVTLGAVASFVVLHYFVLTKVPPTLLGKWIVAEGEQEGATLEFFRDGTMILSRNVDGKAKSVKAKVRVDGDSLEVTLVDPATKTSVTGNQKILTLTDQQLVIDDGQGTVLKLERIAAGDPNN